jgi:hypothetical protein
MIIYGLGPFLLCSNFSRPMMQLRRLSLTVPQSHSPQRTPCPVYVNLSLMRQSLKLPADIRLMRCAHCGSITTRELATRLAGFSMLLLPFDS